MPIVVGIDSSSKAIHAARMDGDKLQLFKWSGTGSKAEDRFYEILESFNTDLQKRKLNGDKIKFVAIEKPIYTNNAKTVIVLSKIVGAIEYILAYNKISYELVDNRTWKKVVLKNGNATKEEILAYAEKKHKRKFEEQDYADAVCIAEWGVKQCQTLPWKL